MSCTSAANTGTGGANTYGWYHQAPIGCADPKGGEGRNAHLRAMWPNAAVRGRAVEGTATFEAPSWQVASHQLLSTPFHLPSYPPEVTVWGMEKFLIDVVIGKFDW